MQKIQLFVKLHTNKDGYGIGTIIGGDEGKWRTTFEWGVTRYVPRSIQQTVV